MPDAPKRPAAAKKPRKPAATTPRATLRRERQRVAQVLHNTLSQELTGIGLMASAAARQHREDCPAAEEKFREIAALVQRAGVGLREFVASLHAEG